MNDVTSSGSVAMTGGGCTTPSTQRFISCLGHSCDHCVADAATKLMYFKLRTSQQIIPRSFRWESYSRVQRYHGKTQRWSVSNSHDKLSLSLQGTAWTNPCTSQLTRLRHRLINPRTEHNYTQPCHPKLSHLSFMGLLCIQRS